MDRLPGWVLLTVSGLLLAVTFFVVVPVLRADFRWAPDQEPLVVPRGQVAVRVEDAVLYREDIALLDLDPDMVDEWYRSELLARTALEEGLEDPAVSRMIQHRARQIYLRDLLLERIASSLDYPTPGEALSYMGLHPDEFLVERHFYHIVVADSFTADSIHQRLSRGGNFQNLARSVSLSQKAALGGDLGFVTGGELFFTGIPRENSTLEGLSPVFQTLDGWHILQVTETRPLDDTARVVPLVRGYLFNQRYEAALESVLEAAALRYDCEVNP